MKREVWEKSCGAKSEGYDFAGRKMVYSSYENRSSLYGWKLVPIKPYNLGGVDRICNLLAVHILTSDEKGDDFPHFKINGKLFYATKVNKHCYKINNTRIFNNKNDKI